MDKFSTAKTAKRLLGQLLVREVGGKRLVGRIVETEAYLGKHDIASHAYKGQTPSNEVMFGPSGHAYVYFTYGMHYCMNVVTAPIGTGEAVLIRALEPLEGIDVMKHNRHRDDATNLCNGPAKLCQALAIDKTLNGHNLSKPPLQLELDKGVADNQVVTATRIGIREENPLPLRFYLKNNSNVSVINK